MLDCAAVAVSREMFDRSHEARASGTASLETFQARVDASPARAHEVDDERKIVHARVTFREELSLEPLETADCLVEQASDLGDVARDGEDLGAESVAYRNRDLGRDRRLELGCRRGEILDLLSRSLESGFQERGVRTAGRSIRDALPGPFQSDFVHRRRGYSHRRMDTALLDYELPPELIAQRPMERRDASRLLVYRPRSGEIEHRVFSELPDVLAGELVVVNDTRVVPARLRLRRATGGAAEVLLLEQVESDGLWEGLVRAGGRPRPGERLGPIEIGRAHV